MIPPLDDHGLLPSGIHACTWQEIEDYFCWNTKRKTVFAGLQRFLDERWAPIGLNCPILVDGSFVRSKTLPEDVDIVLDLSEVTDMTAIASALVLRLKHESIKLAYYCDVWVKHPLIPNDLSRFFQYLGDKGAAELQLSPEHPKGILKVMP